MNKFTKFMSIVALFVFSNLAWSDGPRVNILTNEFEVPCVKVINGDETEGYYDASFIRRGMSHNYELVLAEPSDPAACGSVELFASFTKEGDGLPIIYAECEVHKDADGELLRSEIEVKGKNLNPGAEYTVEITSGGFVIASKASNTDGKVEFDFDSKTEKIEDGATEIDPAFIAGETVSIIDFKYNGETIASLADIACEVDDEDEEDEEDEEDDDDEDDEDDEDD